VTWYVYVARCADGSLYCGIARDVAERIAAHDAGKGARYTRGRGPLSVLVTRRFRSKGNALRIEYAIKQLTRPQKEALISAILDPDGSPEHPRGRSLRLGGRWGVAADVRQDRR
jgi:putative endonuclease